LRLTRVITAGLAAAAALAVTPAWAGAAPAPLVDDTVPDFGAGTHANTVATPAGSVQLGRVMKTEPFEGTALPAAYASLPWEAASTPPGSATVAGGKLSVDGARVHSLRSYGAGQVLDFTATFGAASFQHVGFGNTTEGVGDASTFSSGPWVMFSTGASVGTSLFARVRTGAAPATDLPAIEIPGVVPTASHAYRIAWDATSIRFFVDNMTVPVATQPLATPIAGQMRPAASDFAAGGPVLELDAAGLLLHADAGTFVSRVHDAGDPRALWGTLTATAAAGQVSFATRTGSTGTPDATWSAFEPIGAGGAVTSPPGRYIQYRATLATADDRVTPILERVQLSYDVAPPAAPIVGAFGGTPDTKAPGVRLGTRTVRASRRGVVKVRLTCPADEIRCEIGLRMKYGRNTAGRANVTVDGGDTRKVKVQLSRKARNRLAARGRLRVLAVVKARDAAGNHKRMRFAMTIKPY
jgi:hypothetical protein